MMFNIKIGYYMYLSIHIFQYIPHYNVNKDCVTEYWF